MSWLKSWFHMGLATTMSWPDIRPAASLNLGLIIGVAALDAHVHVVDDGVHVGDGVAVCLQLLPIEPEGDAAGGIGLAGDELQFDEQPRRAAGVVVARLVRAWGA